MFASDNRSTRRRLLRTALVCAMALVVFAVVARFVYTASIIDTGWLLVAEQWKAGAIGYFYPEEAVASREPPNQADYWLRETERILDESEASGRLMMGAAWVLDAPAPAFKAKHLQPSEFPMLPPTVADTERFEQVFEARCGPRCLELARRATELEPASADWRRMQALLTADSPSGGFSHAPRTAQWAELLDEAARRDPDNALYDYLAALFLWAASADYRSAPTTSPSVWIQYSLAVHDPQRFAAGVARFEQGQKKKFLAVGESGLSAIIEFLSRSRLTIAGQDKVAGGSYCVARAQKLIIALMRWQMARCDDRAAVGEAAEALTFIEQRMQALNQVEAAGEWTANELIYEAHRQQTFRRMVELAQENPDLMTAKARDDLVRKWRRAMVRRKVREVAAQLAAKPPAAPLTFTDFLVASVLVLAPASVAVLFCTGLLSWVAARRLDRGEQRARPLAVWQHALAWGIAWSASFAVLGMAPAELIGRETQRWIALAFMAFVPVMIFGFLLWRSRFRFSLRAAFVAIFACAVLCLPLAELARQSMFEMAEAPLIPALGAANLDSATWQRMAHVAPQSWTAAAWQWLMHSGAFYAAIGCPLLVAAWSALRRTVGDAQTARLPARTWRSALYRDAGRSALALAALLLLIDLAMLPQTLVRIERHYEEVTRFFLDPQGSYDEFRKQIKVVERDAESMKGFRQAADAEIEELLKSGF